jgi:soluble lytic murein transglycosylase-like protein
VAVTIELTAVTAAADAGLLPSGLRRLGLRSWALLLGLVFAAVPSRAVADVGEACRAQASIAERAAGIPEGLLLAIGKRESGRFDPQASGVLPWPWAVNREGEGRFFASRAEAVAYVAAAQHEGSRSIDVGCFQINLKYHPTAFASLDEAFDPTANAAYAARFLSELHDREGSWETAVADYHSATPWLGAPYREAVLATWRGVAEVTSQMRSPLLEPVRVIMGIRIWTTGQAAFAPVIFPVSAQSMAAAPAATPLVRGLPRVFTPSVPVAR